MVWPSGITPRAYRQSKSSSRCRATLVLPTNRPLTTRSRRTAAPPLNSSVRLDKDFSSHAHRIYRCLSTCSQRHRCNEQPHGQATSTKIPGTHYSRGSCIRGVRLHTRQRLGGPRQCCRLSHIYEHHRVV